MVKIDSYVSLLEGIRVTLYYTMLGIAIIQLNWESWESLASQMEWQGVSAQMSIVCCSIPIDGLVRYLFHVFFFKVLQLSAEIDSSLF